MEVERPIYLKRLVDRMDNGSVKVVTGVRRCGKSFLLNKLFRGFLLSSGVPEERVVCMKERVGHASRDCLYVPAWVL